METRRNHLKIIGAVGATCAFPFSADELYAQQEPPLAEASHVHTAARPPEVPPFEPSFFTAAEGRVISRIADIIIPATDSPGAVAAGAPQYIDSVVSRNAEQQPLFRNGIAWLNERSHTDHGTEFARLKEEQQVALLKPLSDAYDAGRITEEGVGFFRAMKSLTADGYYTSQPGLVQELGYRGNQVLAHFESCVREH